MGAFRYSLLVPWDKKNFSEISTGAEISVRKCQIFEFDGFGSDRKIVQKFLSEKKKIVKNCFINIIAKSYFGLVAIHS